MPCRKARPRNALANRERIYTNAENDTPPLEGKQGLLAGQARFEVSRLRALP